MAVARGDDGSGNLTRRRLPRKPTSDAPAPSAPANPAPAQPSLRGGAVGLRLDDLYRLPMPKLFQLAEREGISEHTGMNRAQLIVGVVREQIKRGETVRGSGYIMHGEK